VLPSLDELDEKAKEFVADGFDEDGNGYVSNEEMKEWVTPKPTDTAGVFELRKKTDEAVKQIDPYDEFDKVEIDQLKGHPQTAFSPESLKSLIYSVVDQKGKSAKGVANSMAVKLDEAFEALSEGDCAQAADAIEALRSEIKAQTGKTISAEDAKALDALVGIFLCPPEAPE
jgi:hypothetical protein